MTPDSELRKEAPAKQIDSVAAMQASKTKRA
jgi:hypothetical protein